MFISYYYKKKLQLKNSMVKTITRKTKGESQKQVKRDAIHKNQRKDKVNPFRGMKLTHPQPL
jgi:hypothetical protein